MHLEFIDQKMIGPKERQRIRSHVMKGKNSGHARLSRRPLLRPATHPISCSQGGNLFKCTTDAGTHELHKDNHVLDLKPLFWYDLVLSSFPGDLNPSSRSLLHQWFLVVGQSLYPRAVCNKYDMLDSIWVRGVFWDEAYFHSILAIAASFRDNFLGSAQMFPEAIEHLSRAYSLINKRLSGPRAVSDNTIAVVTNLILFHRVHQQSGTGRIHFDGVHRMIHIRGGIGNITNANRALALKPWRLDLEFALQDGSSPRFNAEIMPGSNFLDQLRASQSSLSTTRMHYYCCCTGNAGLLALVLDVINFTDVLNDRKLDPLDYSEASLLLLHRLICFAPLKDSQRCYGGEHLVHITLLVFMSGLLPDYGGNFQHYSLLSNLLRDALHRFMLTAEQNMGLAVWALFVGFIWALDSKDHVSLVPLLREMCRKLSLTSWEDARKILRGCTWISTLHDKHGKELWDTVLSQTDG